MSIKKAISKVRAFAAIVLLTLVGLTQSDRAAAQPFRWIEFHPISIRVTGIDPKEPVEFTPIKISYEIKNDGDKPILGFLTYVGRPTGDGNNGRRVTLAQKATIKGVLTGLAPKAGSRVDIAMKLTYDNLDSSGKPDVESFGIEEVGADAFDVAATYQISVNWFSCGANRVGPGYDDVIDAEARLTLAGQPIGSLNRDPLKPIADRLRNTNMTGVKGDNSVRSTTLAWEDVKSVPGKTEALQLEYLFVNTEAGPGEGMKLVLDIISDGAAAALSTLYAGSGSAWSQVNGDMKKLNGNLKGCQGIVASDLFRFDGSLLDGLTNGTGANQNILTTREFDGVKTWEMRAPGSFYRIMAYDGLPSSVECGGRSLYRIRWSVKRTSFQQ
jgi:hypothetical protein